MQRRHYADLGGAIKSRQHGLPESLVQVTDRGPVHFAVAAVDIADEPCQFVLQISVSLDAPARRVCDLQQRHVAQKRRLQRPHPIEGVDAVDQSLRIVEPVDADRQLFAVQASAQPRYFGMRYGFGRLAGKLLGVDADRKYLDARCAVARLDDATPRDEAEMRLHTAEEILAIVRGLESDQ